MEFVMERGIEKAYLVVNGEYLEIGPGITPLTTTITTEYGTISVPIEIERKARIPVSFVMDSSSAARWNKYLLMFRLADKPCHSRKRYVKLVMGQNFDRDSANNLADLARKNGMSWQRAWLEYCMSWVI